ncbi:MAG: UvrD-helicase domain-containing protein [Bacteroidales bacterium]|jgi:DNA helicase-2/ATP-dependent DNA helicase PcrA|nr:UvrD-helicase domain-containing protein [Bacteroidales bacterium]NLK80448.1 UvrD-helicase domain-containing protein [Bacteroidales bacterium]
MKENYLEELNKAQREAVENTTGPSLIIAGAGSGKTKVLTCRIAHMLEQGIPASSILALTFTNKAAKEMKERLAMLVGPEYVRFLWMGTFHAVFARILRKEAEVLNFPRNFTIYDKSDSKTAIKRCIKELELDEKKYQPGEIMSRISRAKNNLLTANAYRANDQVRLADELSGRPRIADVYALYAKKCQLAGAMDFDDLLLYTNILLQQNEQVLEHYRQQFRYILVDEYQDTNLVQYLIIKNLALTNRNITVVGDDAQSIYAFRGARIENILNFSKDFPEAKEFRLEQNYRSTQTVVKAANSLIKHNTRRMRKECFSESVPGEKIELLSAYTDAEEAFMVVGSITDKMYTTKDGYGAFAILYRTNAQSRLFEEALRRRNIPYKVYGGFSFYERAEVKDMLAYIRLVVNPHDEEAFRRAVAVPSRGIGAVTLQKLSNAAFFSGMSSLAYIQNGDLQAAGLGGSMGERLRAFSQVIETVQASQEEGKNAFELSMEVATLSGYLHMLREDKSIEGMSKLNNVEELFNSLQAFCGVAGEEAELETEVSVPEPGEGKPTLDRFLNNVTLLTQADEQESPDQEKVSLMTAHSAKGLEFSHIYVAGMEERLFPSMLSSDIQEELEEERRLFYVAMTRAKKTLTLSYARSRMRWGKTESNPPSRFLREIDPAFLSRPLSPAPTLNRLGTDFSRPGSAQSGTYRSGFSSQSASGSRPGFAQPTTSRSGFGSQPASGSRPGFAPSATSRPVPSRSSAPRNTSSTEDFVPADPSLLKTGMAIEHDRFGPGRIVSMEGAMPNTKAVIDFEFGGVKTLLLKFAKIRIAEGS